MDRPAAGDRCLSVKQPWSTLIVAGLKRCENRSRPTKYRGRLLIHASARTDYQWEAGWYAGDGDDAIDLPGRDAIPMGVLLGSVELYDCVALADLPPELAGSVFAGGPFCYLLRDARPLAEPVAARGALGIWTWRG
jgi:hypothetical protein